MAVGAVVRIARRVHLDGELDSLPQQTLLGDALGPPRMEGLAPEPVGVLEVEYG